MKQTLALILAVLLLTALCACSEPETNGTEPTAPVPTAVIPTASVPVNSESLPTEDEGPETDPSIPEETVPLVYFSIETPCATLRAPEVFETEVKTTVLSESPYVLGFFAYDDTELFRLHFNDRVGDLLGTLYTEEEPVVLTAEFAALDPESESYVRCTGYQLGLSTILDNLIEDYHFEPDALPAEDSSEVFAIEGPVCTLYYPTRWKELTQIDVTEDAVKFSYRDAPVFDLYFREDPEQADAYLLGSYDGTPLYIVSYLADAESFTEEELTDFYAMQANINVILEHLNEDERFVESH